jgi:hypothetical protein
VVALVRHLLATVMHTKFGEHQLLNCQSERFGREGIDLSIQKIAVQLPQDGVRIPLVLHDARSAPIFSAPRSAQVIEQALARGRAPVGREREGAVIQALKHGHSYCGMESPIACSTPAINPPAIEKRLLGGVRQTLQPQDPVRRVKLRDRDAGKSGERVRFTSANFRAGRGTPSSRCK